MKFTIEFDGKRYGMDVRMDPYDRELSAYRLAELVKNTYLHYYDEKIIMDEQDT